MAGRTPPAPFSCGICHENLLHGSHACNTFQNTVLCLGFEEHVCPLWEPRVLVSVSLKEGKEEEEKKRGTEKKLGSGGIWRIGIKGEIRDLGESEELGDLENWENWENMESGEP